jgi:hypothetical protein
MVRTHAGSDSEGSEECDRVEHMPGFYRDSGVSIHESVLCSRYRKAEERPRTIDSEGDWFQERLIPEDS